MSNNVKPIIFNTEDVLAILDGRKTVTRRIIKPQPPDSTAYFHKFMDNGEARFGWKNSSALCDRKLPYKCDDVLYVRETWRIQSAHRVSSDIKIEFKADGNINTIQLDCDSYDEFLAKWNKSPDIWKSPIYMPKEAARIFLKVANVRVERLQDINNRDLVHEGEIPYIHVDGSFNREATRMSFLSTWNRSIKSKDIDRYDWNANPWVWVIEFEKLMGKDN